MNEFSELWGYLDTVLVLWRQLPETIRSELEGWARRLFPRKRVESGQKQPSLYGVWRFIGWEFEGQVLPPNVLGFPVKLVGVQERQLSVSQDYRPIPLLSLQSAEALIGKLDLEIG
jgi:hypothetical protein